MSRFKVGDRVICVKETYPLVIDDTGLIKEGVICIVIGVNNLESSIRLITPSQNKYQSWWYPDDSFEDYRSVLRDKKLTDLGI